MKDEMRAKLAAASGRSALSPSMIRMHTEAIPERNLTVNAHFRIELCSSCRSAGYLIVSPRVRVSSLAELSVVGRERKDVLTIVEHLKEAGLKCCVLSNTIALHWERLGSAREYPCLGLFDHIFASHLIGCAKPEKEAFSFVANALKVQMPECLLVDDTPLNIETAKALGWRGILFSSTAQLQRDINDLLQAPETSNQKLESTAGRRTQRPKDEL